MKRLKKGALINIFILILIIIVLLYTLLNSNVFNSNKIRIEGNDKISKDYIIKSLDLREDKNIFMYNLKNMEKELKENKYIEDVKVKREFPNKLNIIIIEKEIAGIIQSDDLKCYIDNKCEFIDKVKKDEEIDNYLMIDIGYKLDKNNNIKFKKEKYKNNLVKVLKNIKSFTLYKKIDKVKIEEDYIRMYTPKGLEIVFLNNKNIEDNMKKTEAILIDLQSRKISKGTVDFTQGKNPIYMP